MMFFFKKPLDQSIDLLWNKINKSYKKAFFFVIGVNLLAFGFEMTNLTLQHDDIWQLFIQDDILGHYLGRFGLGWLHFQLQNAHIMPFIQLLEGVVFMSVYGLVISYLWGLKRTTDIVIVSSIVCVFPFMAQVYSYNALTAPYALAHALSAIAVLLSIRATIINVAIAALLYTAAFSIYQAVIANSATIFILWFLSALLFTNKSEDLNLKTMYKPLLGALISVLVGGVIYVSIIWFMDLDFDSYQNAGNAFKLQPKASSLDVIPKILQGTRSFFFWPGYYFPNYLKQLQLTFLVIASILCFWIPKGPLLKISAFVILVISFFSPRLLQFIHIEGNYHNLTLTAYAVTISGFIMIIFRAKYIVLRNMTIIFTSILIGGYIIQCNWISTVNYLNTLAHYSTLNQILARVRSLPDEWNGEKVIVIGNYNMKQEYPYKSITGVATDEMREKNIKQLNYLASLMRDEMTFVNVEQTNTQGALEYARSHPAWPHPKSVGVVDGIGVVVFSSNHLSIVK